MLLSAEHLSINFGSRQLLDDVNFYLNEGDKVGVIGINGTGKSTFLKVLSGVTEPDVPVRLRLVLRGIHQLRRAGRNVHRVGLVCVPLPPARRSQAGAGLAVEPPPGPRPSDQPPLRALA